MIQMLNGRFDFGEYCNEMGYTRAVELGVHQGCFANDFLSRFNGHLTCIDPWDGGDRNFQPAFVPGRTYGDLDCEIATLVLTRKYLDRVTLIRDTAERALKKFPNGHFHWGYVDGLHTLPDVRRDINALWPKIAPGGMMAGHDYEPDDPTLCGVPIAVNAFCLAHDLELSFTRDTGECRSWYVTKPS